ISLCNVAGKPVITATQMLDSMIRNPRPTRAEASDIANAIIDGTDAIMLSGETASGKYPLESVHTMVKIAERTDQSLPYEDIIGRIALSKGSSVTDAISHATVQASAELNASAILTSTQSGWTARMVSKYRPRAPIIAITTSAQTARTVNLLWGVYPVVGPQTTTTDEMMEIAVTRSLEEGLISNGDLVIITAGVPVGVSGTTNLIKVHIVGEVMAKGTPIGTTSAEGTICIAMNAEEALAKLKPGDILVTHDTDKNYVPILHLARGLITEEGGLTSHGAIVGLNLNLATIVGVQGAVKMFKDQELVTIDGASGLIYRGRTRVHGGIK
ncbi:MAG: pyruvate kinase, partial [bacterium]|nr:pyruvate kinase [bacterium]